jgi:hypothetical protein
MADWLASRQRDDRSAVRVAFSEKCLSRRKPEKTGCLKLTQAQRETILGYAALPDELVARLMIEEPGLRNSRFSVEDLNVLQERIRESAHYAKGSVRQRLKRLVKKLAETRSKFPRIVQDG